VHVHESLAVYDILVVYILDHVPTLVNWWHVGVFRPSRLWRCGEMVKGPGSEDTETLTEALGWNEFPSLRRTSPLFSLCLCLYPLLYVPRSRPVYAQLILEGTQKPLRHPPAQITNLKVTF